MDVRVLILSTYPPDRCGIASYTVQVAATLRREGHRVEVISPQPSAGRYWADYSHTMRGVVRALRLSRQFDRTLVEFFPDLLFRPSGRNALTRRWSFARRWIAVAALFRLGRHVQVVMHEAPYQDLVGRTDWRGRVGRVLWRRLVTLPETTSVHTAWERRRVAESVGVDESRIQIVDHGAAFLKRAEPDRELARRELGLAAGQFHFLSIGFLQPHKGFDRAMRGLIQLDADRARLHVVGSVRVPSSEVVAHVEELRRLAVAGSPRITLHEQYVSDELFDRWIVACDAVVLPYRDIWSSGVLERAKLYGRPAIVSDVGGLRDQADPSTRVVRDDAELVNAMAELASERPRQTGMESVPMETEGEPLTHADAMETLRQRAAELRERTEPGSVAPQVPADDGRPAPPAPVALPGVASDGGLRSRLKRFVSRLTRWQLVPIVSGVNQLRDYVIDVQGRPDAEVQALRDELGSLRREIDQVRSWATDQVTEYRQEVARQEERRGADRAQLVAEMAMLRPARVPPGRSAGATNGQVPGDAHLAALYEAHQERFRGSRALIKRRQEVYLPHVMAAAAPGAPVLDIGPGRGEWLELLRERGIAAYGVDLNERFVEDAAGLGLDVRHGDGIAHLHEVADGSLSAVTAFHVIEHVPFEALVDLVDHGLRALRPGGMLILETPNPVNLAVGAASFHLDPTHVRPIHPLFLEFLLQNRGFVSVRVLPLHPPDEPAPQASPQDGEAVRQAAELLDRHFFAGQDYAVLGHRGTMHETAASGDSAAAAPAGIREEEGATR
jgi:glycosyltransferase involved in cell wall biosynthesis/2-polyprenyl-3-methyl-5-hydroxy-6-metoxy-1,4-benzoquinol methylase